MLSQPYRDAIGETAAVGEVRPTGPLLYHRQELSIG